MTTIGKLGWLNETGLSPYPLTTGFGYNSFLVDANFIQFDNFIPILQTIAVTDDTVSINILFDVGVITVSDTISFFSTPGVTKKIYDSTNRYLGKLVFGMDVPRLVQSDMANLTIKKINTPFLSHLVKSIPSNAGVYSIAGLFGAITFDHDTYIWYDVTSNDVTFNAVSGLNYSTTPYLKTLNSVTPLSNSVYLKDSEILKISSAGNSTVEIDMVGTSTEDLTQPQNIIVTSG